MINNDQPKILIFTVSSWNSKVGANTWASILKNYNSANLANICIRNEIPDSEVCSRYFSISENKILKSIFRRKIKTGQEIQAAKNNDTIAEDLEKHNQRYQKMSKKRTTFKLLCRELVWKFGRWKTKELNNFLDDFKPDIILHSMEGYIHLNRIIEYSIRRTQAKAIGYIWDDNFTYKQSSKNGYKFYRFFQRKSLRKLAKKTKAFFAITEKTKREADEFFGIECNILSKPLNAVPEVKKYDIKKQPLRILYTGNLLIGRDATLAKIVKVLSSVNMSASEYIIDVYTQTKLFSNSLAELNSPFCTIHPPITQEEVLHKQKEADILLFLEDLSNENLSARLSFSTKITDYLSAGKCIFAVGNRDLAPMEYFEKNAAALVAYNIEDIEANFKKILQDRNLLNVYATNAMNCGINNHNPEMIFEECNKVIIRVYKSEQ